MSALDGTRRVVILGGGISGLATAHFVRKMAREQGRPVEVSLLEKESRAGGKFDARREEGFLVEAGPNGFLDSKPFCDDWE